MTSNLLVCMLGLLLRFFPFYKTKKILSILQDRELSCKAHVFLLTKLSCCVFGPLDVIFGRSQRAGSLILMLIHPSNLKKFDVNRIIHIYASFNLLSSVGSQYLHIQPPSSSSSFSTLHLHHCLHI